MYQDEDNQESLAATNRHPVIRLYHIKDRPCTNIQNIKENKHSYLPYICSNLHTILHSKGSKMGLPNETGRYILQIQRQPDNVLRWPLLRVDNPWKNRRLLKNTLHEKRRLLHQKSIHNRLLRQNLRHILPISVRLLSHVRFL